jgi:hypothetical protein
LLEREADFQVVGEAEDGRAAVEMTQGWMLPHRLSGAIRISA